MAETIIDWRRLLLDKIDAPANQTNLTALGAWAASEGMPIFTNNPLAATTSAPGATPYPKAPIVKVYLSVEQAADVYAGMLNSSLYRPIRDALRASEDYQAIFEAINASPWCGGCQGGKYPIGLWSIVFGNVSPQPPPQDRTPVHEWVIPAEPPPTGIKDLHRSWDQLTRALGHVLPASVNKANRYVDRLTDAVD
jgi:hypothetical protein